MKRNKYGNKRTEVDGIVFSSKKEARRYGELRMLQVGKVIGNITLQPRYPLVVKGIKVGTYVGDFEYTEGNRVVVEDAKGVQTPVFKLKWKLVRILFPEYEWRIV